MYKINYPNDPTRLTAFKDTYYKSLSKKYETELNKELSKINCSNGIPLTFKRLATMNFEDLVGIKTRLSIFIKAAPGISKIDNQGKPYQLPFEDLFNYKTNQGNIAKFFMSSSDLKLKTCYYCNISFVNAFSQFPNYKDKKEFVNEAKFYELMFIKGIDKNEALKIISNRPYSSASDKKLSTKSLALLKKFTFSRSHNHFTLDHVLPQSENKFFSLCLYNFVPSCYSCNSKFKKALKFRGSDNDLKYISPTSPNFSFTKDYEFKILFTKQYKYIKSVDDFSIEDKIHRNEDHIGSYLRMFKLTGRYSFHKDIILDLVQKKIKYPDSKIRRISKKTGVSQIELRRRIFGIELFKETITNEPFVKFKRDIAKQINIQGVLKD